MDAVIGVDDEAAAEILEAVAATLDHQHPRWRLCCDRLLQDWQDRQDRQDGLPSDDREALRALSRVLLGRARIPSGVFGDHPELLARASPTEIQAEAEQLARRPRAVPLLVEQLLRLRDHARRIQTYQRAAGMPFAAALRSAHEAGRLEAFFGRLPADAPPFSGASSLAEFRRAFAPSAFQDPPELIRFLKRLGLERDSATSRQLRLARLSVAEFIGGSRPICAATPKCGRCELLARGLCEGEEAKVEVRPKQSGQPKQSGRREQSGLPKQGGQPKQSGRREQSAARPAGRPRGRELVRRAAWHLSELDARWLALRSRRAPEDARARKEWIRSEIGPAFERLRIGLCHELARIERGLRWLEEERVAEASDANNERARIWEQAWRIVSRLKAIERERLAYHRTLRQDATRDGPHAPHTLDR